MFGIALLLTAAAVSRAAKEHYSEHLSLSALPNHDVLTSFNFSIKASSVEEGMFSPD